GAHGKGRTQGETFPVRNRFVIKRINVAWLQGETKVCFEIIKEVNHVFNLSDELPIRATIYSFRSDYYLSVVVHHIAFDGWSVDVLLKELEEYYRYYRSNLEDKLNLPYLGIQYKDFALWQRSYLTGERLERQLGYWRDKLAGYSTLNLIIDKPRPKQINYAGEDYYFEIEEEKSESLRKLAKNLNISLYSLLLAAYYLMLRVYSNQDDIVIGSPIANRHYAKVENLIGFFINSLALRVKIDTKDSIRKFIQEVGDSVIEAQLYQDLPFEKLVEELNISKDTSRHPIFQVMFSVQNFGWGNGSSILEYYEPSSNPYRIAKFDLSTFIDDKESRLRGVFNYATSLYDEITISGYVNTYKMILDQLGQLSVEQLGEPISSLKYISANEYEQVIVEWNKTEREYPNEKTIHELFEDLRDHLIV
ncbi:MAG: hypothetical protein EB127_22360, partial [Alphaproteobacteria bacterium]|nr:hypothetical protein [Alphaproteobacteria bacterium]